MLACKAAPALERHFFPLGRQHCSATTTKTTTTSTTTTTTKIPSSSTTKTTDNYCAILDLAQFLPFCTSTAEYDVEPHADEDEMYLIKEYQLKYLPSNESEHEHFDQDSSYFEDVSIWEIWQHYAWAVHK